jgi:hypothetical protein
MSFTKEEFMVIMDLADKIEDHLEGGDFILGINALMVVAARGGRLAMYKSDHGLDLGQVFTREDFVELFGDKVAYWWDFYDHLDEIDAIKAKSQ